MALRSSAPERNSRSALSLHIFPPFGHHLPKLRKQRGVPPAALDFLLHGHHGFVVREGAFVGALGRESVIDVADLQDARRHGNRIGACFAVWGLGNACQLARRGMGERYR